MFKMFALIVLVISVVLGLAYFFQHRLIYFPDTSEIKPEWAERVGMQQITLHTKDDLKLIAWYKPATYPQLPTILYLHGNAANILNRVPLVQPYLRGGFGVLLLEYRGYAQNPGQPNEQGLYKDGRAALKYLYESGLPTQCVVLYGESLGTAVAIELAVQYPLAGVILQSPFTSLASLAETHYPFLPTRLLLKESYDSKSRISRVHSPLLFLHGKQDAIVPVELGTYLYSKANPPKTLKVYPELGHNDIFSSQLVLDVFEFLKDKKCTPL